MLNYQAETIVKKTFIKDEVEIQEMLQFFHGIGVVVYWNHTDELKNIITIKPQWIVDSFTNIIHDPELHEIKDENLVEWRNKLEAYIPEEVKKYFIESNSETHLNFPVAKYPEKPQSLNLIKTPEYTGKLVGVKGQYLIFEDDTVFNIRANEGLVVSIELV